MENEGEQILSLRIRKTLLIHVKNKGLIMSEDVPLYSLRNLDLRKSLGSLPLLRSLLHSLRPSFIGLSFVLELCSI